MLAGMRSNISSLILAGLGLFALAGAAPGGAAGSFVTAWAAVTSYTADIAVHETKGTDVQDRTYHYAFLKPHFAKIDVTGGPGKGSGASWTGGDTVSGHQGGFLSGIHMKVSLHDGRSVDMRGYTMDQASFDAMAKMVTDAPSVTNGEDTWKGATYDTVSVPWTDGEGATKRVLYLSKTTHMPVRRVTFAGDTIVMDETFTNVNLAAGLKESDF